MENEDKKRQSKSSQINGEKKIKSKKRKSKKNSITSNKSKKSKGEETNINNYKSQSNKNTLLKNTKLEKQEISHFSQKSQNVHISSNYNKELINKYSLFLQREKFKISNEFDAKNSKKFLEKKDKCLERLILCDEIENNDNIIEKPKPQVIKQKKKRRNSGTNKNISNYCIVISDYDDDSKNEIKFHYSVKHQPRKLENFKKNKNLSKYFLSNEPKSPSKFLDSSLKI